MKLKISQGVFGAHCTSEASESTQALSGERAPCFAQGRVRVFTCFYIGLLGIEKQLLRMTI